jgi:hypothetical protein
MHLCLLLLGYACPSRSQVLYISSMIRSVIALHDLVLNKIAFKDVEEARDKEEKAKTKEAGAGACRSCAAVLS